MFTYNIALPLSSVTDGTSNTIIFSERANGKFGAAASMNCYCWWGDAISTDTIFTTLYPMNPFNKVPVISGEYSFSWDDSASSFHPGGATSRSATARCGSSRTRSRPGRSTRRPASRMVCPMSTGS